MPWQVSACLRYRASWIKAADGEPILSETAIISGRFGMKSGITAKKSIILIDTVYEIWLNK